MQDGEKRCIKVRGGVNFEERLRLGSQYVALPRRAVPLCRVMRIKFNLYLRGTTRRGMVRQGNVNLAFEECQKRGTNFIERHKV